jgi:uncharacterized protein (DUF1330 family)
MCVDQSNDQKGNQTMKSTVKLAAIVFIGLTVGATAVTALRAQTSPPKAAYVIANVDISDKDAYRAYAAKVPDTLKPYNGRIIVRGAPISMEGAAPKGIVVMLAFDSLDNAQKWYASPAYSALIPERQKAAKAQLYVVETLPQ